MNIQLKKAIFNYMVDNNNLFNLVNNTIEHFKQYIYLPDGNYCIGGAEVSDFIKSVEKLLKP